MTETNFNLSTMDNIFVLPDNLAMDSPKLSISELAANITTTDYQFIFEQTVAQLQDHTPTVKSPTSSPSSKWDFYIKGILLPAIGLFGVLGNILNLLILSWRYKRRDVDVLEKGALLGLMALAVSDMCFCFGLLPLVFFYKQKLIFSEKGPHLYFQLYNMYYQNYFIRTSTWLTLLVGLARFCGICYPLRARIFICLIGIRVAVVITYIFWLLFLLPMLWKYNVHTIPITNDTSMYFIDIGAFNPESQMFIGFSYAWAIIGYFIPVCLVAFCNIRLIGALRESARLRRTDNARFAHRDYTTRITLTLVSLIIAFIILVSPSEIVHFYSEVVNPNTYNSYELAVHATNVLQACNFAFHFALYCAVNATFRRALVLLFWAKINSFRRPPVKRNSPTIDRRCIVPVRKNSFVYRSRSSTSRSADSYL